MEHLKCSRAWGKLLFEPMFSQLFIACAATAFLSYLLSLLSIRLATRWRAIDAPTLERKQHGRSVPRFGGIGIGLSMLLVIFFAWNAGWFNGAHISSFQLIGFSLGVLVLLVGGIWDDLKDLPSHILIWFPLAASLLVTFTGTLVRVVTQIGSVRGSSLVWRTWLFSTYPHLIVLIWPASLITFLWLLSVTAATKFADGLDGLVTGQTMIGACLIAALALSPRYAQPSIALFAAIVGGAFLGFLPLNVFPAKQFLGEAGSTIAGFALGTLAIVSGAKMATALMALGVPLADIVFVMLGRIWRGQHPFHGDRTHLHFRLLQLGLTQRQAVAMLWMISITFGIGAFALQTRGKILLLLALGCLTFVISWFAKRRAANMES